MGYNTYAYVRSRRDGFLAPMGAAAPSRDADGSTLHRVAFLNPGSNWRQRSLLRLVNPGGGDAEVSIEGTDDTGLRPGSPVRLTVPAGGAHLLRDLKFVEDAHGHAWARRMRKLLLKTCRKVRELDAQAHCRTSSYLQSMALQGWNPLTAIEIALNGNAADMVEQPAQDATPDKAQGGE